MKRCIKCDTSKSEDEFPKRHIGNSKTLNTCKSCVKEYVKKYRSENKDKIREYSKKYSIENKAKLSQYGKEYRQKNREKYRQYSKWYVKKNFESVSKKNKERYHKTRIQGRIRANNYANKRRQTDAGYRILNNLKRRLLLALKGLRKSDASKKLIGCDSATLVLHLERQFKKGMSWSNYGSYWHIDHIIPCDYFDMRNDEDQKKCFHYTNLQPLEAKENRYKSNKIIN